MSNNREGEIERLNELIRAMQHDLDTSEGLYAVDHELPDEPNAFRIEHASLKLLGVFNARETGSAFKVGQHVLLRLGVESEVYLWVYQASFQRWVGEIVASAVYRSHVEYTVRFDISHELAFTSDELEPLANEVELARLQSEIERLKASQQVYVDVLLSELISVRSEALEMREALQETERQRDISYVAFDDVYRAMDKLAEKFVELDVIPQSVLDEFRSSVSVYKPLLEAARKAISQSVNPTEEV